MSEFERYESAEDFGLDQFDEEFETVEAPEYDEVPDGKFQARVDSVKLENSSKGDPMLKWDLVILNGTFAGRHVFKNAVISQASLPYVKRDLKTLGLGLTKFSELAHRLEELLDVTVEITKRTRGDYTNVYFNRRLQLAVTPGSGIPDQDAPF